MTNWIPIKEWKDLPVGTWLTKTEGDNRPYNIADVGLNFQKQKMIIVGGHFHFDMDKPVAYTDFEKYEK